MKILIDMNLSPTWTDYLKAAGVEAEHWSQSRSHDAPDAEIISFAETNHFAVLTRDLDFTTALALRNLHRPSVIQIRAGLALPHEIGSQVVAALKQRQTEVERGALITISPDKHRVRILPLRSH